MSGIRISQRAMGLPAPKRAFVPRLLTIATVSSLREELVKHSQPSSLRSAASSRRVSKGGASPCVRRFFETVAQPAPSGLRSELSHTLFRGTASYGAEIFDRRDHFDRADRVPVCCYRLNTYSIEAVDVFFSSGKFCKMLTG